MVSAELLQLAEGGLRSVSASALADLAASCRQSLVATASARDGVLAEIMEVLAGAWEAQGYFHAATVDAMDDLLRRELPQIISEPDEQAATSLAAALRESVVLSLLTG